MYTIKAQEKSANIGINRPWPKEKEIADYLC